MPSSTSSASVALSSDSSVGQQIGYKVRNLAMAGKPAVEIKLNTAHGTHGDYVTSFSTMDRIDGSVSITPKTDTRFDDIEICLIGKPTPDSDKRLGLLPEPITQTHADARGTGQSRTFVERMGTGIMISGGRSEACHRFLKMTQPIDETMLPHPRIAVAGRTYTFPFTFVVPERLLPRACSHKLKNSLVSESHLMLPPSMGDPSLAGFGNTLVDDMAPEMAKVLYSLKVRMTQNVGDDEVTLVEQNKKIRIKPAFEEQPPLNIVQGDDDYSMRHEKTIRKGVFKGKLGTLAVQADQPRPFVIPGARSNCECGPISTMVRVQLRFDPTDKNAEPPKLSTISSKMKILTHYATTARIDFPTKATLAYDMSQGYYTASIPLSSLSITSAPWERHDASSTARPASASRRDSGVSDLTDDAGASSVPPTAQYAGGRYYTASITVPVSLPNTKNFLPTFHSCLVSRVYALHLAVAIPRAASGLSIKVPVQVVAEGSAAGTRALAERERETAAAADVDAMMEPRSIAPPPGDEYANVGMGSGRHDSVAQSPPRSPPPMQQQQIREEQREDSPPDYQPFTPHSRIVNF